MDEIESKIKADFDSYFKKTEAAKTVTEGKDIKPFCYDAFREASLPLYVKIKELEDYKDMYENISRGY